MARVLMTKHRSIKEQTTDRLQNSKRLIERYFCGSFSNKCDKPIRFNISILDFEHSRHEIVNILNSSKFLYVTEDGSRQSAVENIATDVRSLSRLPTNDGSQDFFGKPSLPLFFRLLAEQTPKIRLSNKKILMIMTN